MANPIVPAHLLDASTGSTPPGAAATNAGEAPAAQPSAGSLYGRVAALAKDTKEILGGLTALAAAIALALNHFATSHALECFKAETNHDAAQVQSILQVNELTASWKAATELLQGANMRTKAAANADPMSALVAAALKDVIDAQAQLDDIDIKLKAARTRRADLEKKQNPC